MTRRRSSVLALVEKSYYNGKIAETEAALKKVSTERRRRKLTLLLKMWKRKAE
jgi:hypothetical protein